LPILAAIGKNLGSESLRKNWNPSFFFGSMLLAMLEQVQEPDRQDSVIGGDEIFIYSSEQFRESGTYTQTSRCEEGGVNINLAHARDGEVGYVILGLELPGYFFLRFKPTNRE
jgi:hypothetical protein